MFNTKVIPAAFFTIIITGVAFTYGTFRYLEESEPVMALNVQIKDKILSKTEKALDDLNVTEILVSRSKPFDSEDAENTVIFNPTTLDTFYSEYRDEKVAHLEKVDGDWVLGYKKYRYDLKDVQKSNVLIGNILKEAELTASVRKSMVHKKAYINANPILQPPYEEWLKSLEVIIRRNNVNAVNIDMWMEWSNWSMHHQSNIGPYEAYGRAVEEGLSMQIETAN
jgi:hypothetical protein